MAKSHQRKFGQGANPKCVKQLQRLKALKPSFHFEFFYILGFNGSGKIFSLHGLFPDPTLGTSCSNDGEERRGLF